MTPKIRIISVIAALLGILVLGYGIFKVITPANQILPKLKLNQNQGSSTAAAPANLSDNASATQTAPQTSTVDYTDKGFLPKTITVQKGNIVKFINQSSQPMWVATNPHPVHNGYPTSGGCINSTFDSCQGIASGGSWSFKFDIPGSWGYHNHLAPRDQGVVIVK